MTRANQKPGGGTSVPRGACNGQGILVEAMDCQDPCPPFSPRPYIADIDEFPPTPALIRRTGGPSALSLPVWVHRRGPVHCHCPHGCSGGAQSAVAARKMPLG